MKLVYTTEARSVMLYWILQVWWWWHVM